MRTLMIAGNWKMNPATHVEAVALADAVKAGVGQQTSVRVALCPPAVFLSQVDSALAGSPIGLGAQNMHWETAGAHTGEISGAMLVDTGCTHVILGHSERRHGMGETDAVVNAKLRAALAIGLIPIVCLGETKDQRLTDQTEEVLLTQLTGSLAEITPEQMAGTVLAYEPVWAIGTGLTATPEQAQAAHHFIRGWLKGHFGEATGARVIVQYGGSVKPDNAAELLACPDIDGALVGGASLKATDFLAIFRAGLDVTPKQLDHYTQRVIAVQFIDVILGILNFVIVLLTLFLIGIILIQRGKGGGLAGAFGGVGGSSAFGTKTGDIFTKITVGVAIAWILLSMLMVVLTNRRNVSAFDDGTSTSLTKSFDSSSTKTKSKDKSKPLEDVPAPSTTPSSTDNLPPVNIPVLPELPPASDKPSPAGAAPK